DPPHAQRPRRGQARGAGPRRGPVQPSRVQHREPRGGADRGRGPLADDHRRQRRGVAARAGHQAAQQAHRGHQDRRARPRALGGPGAAARQGEGRRRHPRPGPRARPALPGQGRRRGDRRRHRPGRRQHRQARRLPEGRGALRHPRARAVRHGRHRPWLPLDHRADPQAGPHARPARRQL
ncbi:MAG: Acetolactate synthase small subunit, partial [uncultured Nocardioidaceae bacterium]